MKSVGKVKMNKIKSWNRLHYKTWQLNIRCDEVGEVRNIKYISRPSQREEWTATQAQIMPPSKDRPFTLHKHTTKQITKFAFVCACIQCQMCKLHLCISTKAQTIFAFIRYQANKMLTGRLAKVRHRLHTFHLNVELTSLSSIRTTISRLMIFKTGQYEIHAAT